MVLSVFARPTTICVQSFANYYTVQELADYNIGRDVYDGTFMGCPSFDPIREGWYSDEMAGDYYWFDGFSWSLSPNTDCSGGGGPGGGCSAFSGTVYVTSDACGSPDGFSTNASLMYGSSEADIANSASAGAAPNKLKMGSCFGTAPAGWFSDDATTWYYWNGSSWGLPTQARHIGGQCVGSVSSLPYSYAFSSNNGYGGGGFSWSGGTVSDWYLLTPNVSTLGGSDYFKEVSGKFEGKDLDQTAEWYSKLISGSFTNVSISLDVNPGVYNYSADLTQVYYKLDGGSWVRMGYLQDAVYYDDAGSWSAGTITITGLTVSSSLQVKVTMYNANSYASASFDNLTIEEVATCSEYTSSDTLVRITSQIVDLSSISDINSI